MANYIQQLKTERDAAQEQADRLKDKLAEERIEVDALRAANEALRSQVEKLTPGRKARLVNGVWHW